MDERTKAILLAAIDDLGRRVRRLESMAGVRPQPAPESVIDQMGAMVDAVGTGSVKCDMRSEMDNLNRNPPVFTD